MRSLVAALAGAACAFGLAGSARAAIVFNTGSLGGLTQVHSTGTQSADTVFGALQGGGPQVSVHSSDGLSVNGSGYAQFNGPFTTVDLSFTTFTGGFTAANFGLFAAGVNGRNGVPAYLNVFAYDLGGVALPVVVSDGGGGFIPLNLYSLSQGLNSFNISATSGEILSSLSFAAYSNTGAPLNPRELGDIRHIDLNAVPAPVSAIPEPATWAMMIIGFAGIGGMLRHTRRRELLSAAA